MTFNAQSRGSKNYYNDINSSLINNDEDVKKMINNLNANVFDFDNCYGEIKEYHKNVSGMTEKEFSQKKTNIHNQIDLIPGLIKEINTSILNLENAKVSDSSLQTKVNECMRNVNNRIRPKQQDMSKIIYEITEKEKARSDFNQAPISDKEMERFSSLENKSFRDSNALLSDVQFNDQVMKARETELLHVQKVSNQVKEMTSYMNQAVQDQGKILGKFILTFNR